MQNKLRQRLLLFVIIIAFIIPAIAAYLVYHHYQHHKFHTTNHGILIVPAIQVGHFRVALSDQLTKTIATLNGTTIRERWILSYMAPNMCEDVCLNVIHNLNQLATVMAKTHSQFLPLVVQVTDHPPLPRIEAKVSYATMTELQLHQWFLQLPLAYQPSFHGAMYLIDPHGFLIMYYPIENDYDHILKDLQHLIRS